MTEPADDPVEAVSLTAEALGHDLLQALLDEVKLHIGWQSLSSAQQHEIIERLRKRTRHLITEGLNVLFRGAYPAVGAQLDSITIKNGISVKATIPKGSRAWHELADAQGQQILLVVADPELYAARMDEIKAAADQGDLFDGSYKGTQGYRRDETPPPPDVSWADVTKKMEDEGMPPPDAEPVITFGQAADEPAPKKSMGQQAQELLATVFCIVPLETAERWTEQECAVAAFWAIEYAKNPDTAPARPHWLPIPEPFDPEPIEAESDVTESQAEDEEADSNDAEDTETETESA